MHKTLLAAACAMILVLAACQGRQDSVEVPASSKEPPPATSAQDQALPPGQVTCSIAGPQSPRDVDQDAGENTKLFPKAPPYDEMKLCDIHFHRFAEHKASGFPTATGTGKYAGFACASHEPPEGAEPQADAVCEDTTHLGDTVEVHWVFTSCDSEGRLGPGLGSCVKGCIGDPVLRVEGRVFYLTDAPDALDFKDFSDVNNIQVPPADGAVEYLGSTTGPQFNPEGICSAFQVTWNVGTMCSPLRLDSLGAWCSSNNVFNERVAHGVRTLVEDVKLLSPIE